MRLYLEIIKLPAYQKTRSKLGPIQKFEIEKLNPLCLGKKPTPTTELPQSFRPVLILSQRPLAQPTLFLSLQHIYIVDTHIIYDIADGNLIQFKKFLGDDNFADKKTKEVDKKKTEGEKNSK